MKKQQIDSTLDLAMRVLGAEENCSVDVTGTANVFYGSRRVLYKAVVKRPGKEDIETFPFPTEKEALDDLDSILSESLEDALREAQDTVKSLKNRMKA